MKRLFIQEGEKKAEKACKHGMYSLAISGIQNIACGGRLPEDLIRIIEKCHVQEVFFIMDSDWNDLSTNIRINDQVEKRPRNFYYAARNFRDYMGSLRNRELYVEIYVGHVQKNEQNEKGIDDLLAGSLQGKEQELMADFDKLINEKNLTGRYLQFFAYLHILTTSCLRFGDWIQLSILPKCTRMCFHVFRSSGMAHTGGVSMSPVSLSLLRRLNLTKCFGRLLKITPERR